MSDKKEAALSIGQLLLGIIKEKGINYLDLSAASGVPVPTIEAMVEDDCFSYRMDQFNDIIGALGHGLEIKFMKKIEEEIYSCETCVLVADCMFTAGPNDFCCEYERDQG